MTQHPARKNDKQKKGRNSDQLCIEIGKNVPIGHHDHANEPQPAKFDSKNRDEGQHPGRGWLTLQI